MLLFLSKGKRQVGLRHVTLLYRCKCICHVRRQWPSHNQCLANEAIGTLGSHVNIKRLQGTLKYVVGAGHCVDWPIVSTEQIVGHEKAARNTSLVTNTITFQGSGMNGTNACKNCTHV